MTSIVIATLSLSAILAVSLGVLSRLATRAERRDAAARANRYRGPSLQPTAELFALADRRKAPRQDVEIERRRAA